MYSRCSCHVVCSAVRLVYCKMSFICWIYEISPCRSSGRIQLPCSDWLLCGFLSSACVWFLPLNEAWTCPVGHTVVESRFPRTSFLLVILSGTAETQVFLQQVLVGAEKQICDSSSKQREKSSSARGPALVATQSFLFQFSVFEVSQIKARGAFRAPEVIQLPLKLYRRK